MATTSPSAAPEPTAEPSSTATTEKTTKTTKTPTWEGEYPPFTTAWSMPESCGYTIDLDHLPDARDSGTTVYLDWTIESGAATFSCYPEGMFERGNSGTFSPASCPVGWYTVSMTESDTHTKTRTRTCCSKSYTMDASSQYCESVDTGTVRPTGVTFSDSSHIYLPPTDVPLPPLTNATLAHHKMVIIFEDKDQEILGVQDSDSLLDPEPQPDDDPLSLGAKAGIGIGAATGFSILLFLAIWLFRRSYYNRRARARRKMLPYELGQVRRDSCRASEESAHEDVGVARQVTEVDPPPAYEASPSQVSLEAVTPVRTPEEELRVLKAQQERIQLRIEELELHGVGSERGSDAGEEARRSRGA